jgi:hypothetical protein
MTLRQYLVCRECRKVAQHCSKLIRRIPILFMSWKILGLTPNSTALDISLWRITPVLLTISTFCGMSVIPWRSELILTKRYTPVHLSHCMYSSSADLHSRITPQGPGFVPPKSTHRVSCCTSGFKQPLNPLVVGADFQWTEPLRLYFVHPVY